MDSLAEYNDLMAKAGRGDIAKALEEKHKPDPEAAKVAIPEDMLTASEYAKRIYLKNKRYRDAADTRQYLMAYRAQREVCPCGAIISKPNIKSHQRSAKCKQKIKDLASCGKGHAQTRLAWGLEQPVLPSSQPQPSHPAPSASQPVLP